MLWRVLSHKLENQGKTVHVLFMIRVLVFKYTYCIIMNKYYSLINVPMPGLIQHDIKTLKRLPETQTPLCANTTYSIGDTHGNAIALIRYLHEAAVLSVNKEDYQILLDIYNNTLINKTVSADGLKLFRIMLQKALKNIDQIPQNVKFRCFGDMLADRGACDVYTLIILDELRKNRPTMEFTILLSNHDKEFISQYLSGLLLDDNEDLNPECSPIPSLETLKLNIVSKVIDKKELDQMIQSAYFPCLKLLDFTENKDGSIDIMSHAPLTLGPINKAMTTLLPKELHLDIYASIENVKTIITALNALFIRKTSQTGTLEFDEVIRKALIIKSKRSILNDFIWPRLFNLQQLSPEEFKRHKYKAQFRHGHDGVVGETIIHGVKYIGYNNVFGKSGLSEGIMSMMTQSESIFKGQVVDQSDVLAAAEEVQTEIEPATLLDDDMPLTPPIEGLSPQSFFNPKASSFTRKSVKLTNNSLELSKQLEAFKTIFVASFNSYINTRGSLTGTERGDHVWVNAAQLANYCGSWLNRSLDVPRVDVAKLLKQHILDLKITDPCFIKNLTDFENLLKTSSVKLKSDKSFELARIIDNLVDFTAHGVKQIKAKLSNPPLDSPAAAGLGL